MSAIKYDVMCRYYNVNMKMPITNLSTEKWISCFDNSIPQVNKNNVCKEVFEFCTDKNNAQQQRKVQDLLIEGNNSANPKFNMFFMYNSRDFKYSSDDSLKYPYALIDKMERVVLSPWFVHSTHGSLQAAMNKARALANKIGHENIKIGKVIPLDQYIEIV